MATSRNRRRVQLALAVISLIGSGMTMAAEEPATMPAPSKDVREKMAAVHDKMAACLRSDKSFAECRGEMRQNCTATMGEQGCPMMGMGMGMGGRMNKP